MSHYLITGGSGFLGRHILLLLQADAKVKTVTVLMRNPDDWAALDWTAALSKVQLLQGEINNPSEWQDSPLLKKLDGIFHLAAYIAHNRRERAAMFFANVDGTNAVADVAAAKNCRLLYVSTSGTVGCFRDAQAVADETAAYVEKTVSSWPYYASKIASEKQCLARIQKGENIVIIRPPIMLGPGDHRYRSTGLLLKFMNRKLPLKIRGGFPFVDIRDAAQAMITAMQHPAPQPVYHLPGTQLSIDELFHELERISGTPAPRLVFPEALVLGLAKADEKLGLLFKKQPLGLVPDPVVIEMGLHYWGLTSLYAANDLQFKPRSGIVTLKDTIQWLKQNPPLGH